MALVDAVEEGAALPRLGLVRALPRPPRQRQGVELVLKKTSLPYFGVKLSCVWPYVCL